MSIVLICTTIPDQLQIPLKTIHLIKVQSRARTYMNQRDVIALPRLPTC
jgi:hypothetical protein